MLTRKTSKFTEISFNRLVLSPQRPTLNEDDFLQSNVKRRRFDTDQKPRDNAFAVLCHLEELPTCDKSQKVTFKFCRPESEEQILYESSTVKSDKNLKQDECAAVNKQE